MWVMFMLNIVAIIFTLSRQDINIETLTQQGTSRWKYRKEISLPTRKHSLRLNFSQKAKTSGLYMLTTIKAGK